MDDSNCIGVQQIDAGQFHRCKFYNIYCKKCSRCWKRCMIKLFRITKLDLGGWIDVEELRHLGHASLQRRREDARIESEGWIA